MVFFENTSVLGNILPIGVVDPIPREPKLNDNVIIWVVEETASESNSLFTPKIQEKGKRVAACAGIAKN